MAVDLIAKLEADGLPNPHLFFFSSLNFFIKTDLQHWCLPVSFPTPAPSSKPVLWPCPGPWGHLHTWGRRQGVEWPLQLSPSHSRCTKPKSWVLSPAIKDVRSGVSREEGSNESLRKTHLTSRSLLPRIKMVSPVPISISNWERIIIYVCLTPHSSTAGRVLFIIFLPVYLLFLGPQRGTNASDLLRSISTPLIPTGVESSPHVQMQLETESGFSSLLQGCRCW